jgi:hypothetical protein
MTNPARLPARSRAARRPRIGPVGGLALGLLLLASGLAQASAHPVPFSAVSSGSIPFASPRYPVNFTTVGLPPGTAWNVTVGLAGVAGPGANPQTLSTTSGSLVMLLANGSYAFSAFCPAAEASGAPSTGFDNGTFTVGGRAVQVTLQWPSSFSYGGPSAPTMGGANVAFGSNIGDLALAAALVVVVALFAIASVRVGQRSTRHLPPAPAPPPIPTVPPSPGPALGASLDAASTDPLRHML